MKVYEGNWGAKNRDHLIQRVKMKQKDIVIKMLDHLKVRVHNQNGLQSLQKI